MSARIVNLVISQGTDFSSSFMLEEYNDLPIDLSGYTGTCHIKKHPSSSTKYAMIVSFPDPLYGEIKVSIGSTITSTIKEGRYLYDILLQETATGLKTRVVEGTVTVTAGVSTT
jgi:hypothetical protein